MIERSFFPLLQVALGTRDNLPSSLSDDDWRNMLAKARRHAIAGLLVEGLERLPKEQRPSKVVLMMWLGALNTREKKYTVYCKRAVELTSLFAEAGYRSSVLKGIGTAQFYPNPAHRQNGDIDLWVDASWDEVRYFLRKKYVIKHAEWHHIAAKFFADVEVEIHIRPSWLYRPCKNKILQRWYEQWKEKGMNVDESLGFAHQPVEFDAVFSLTHTFHHWLEEGVDLRHIIDYYYILKALPASSREATMKVLKEIGLSRFTGAVMWVLREACGMDESLFLCPPDEKEGRFLLDDVISWGRFGGTGKYKLKRNSWARFRATLPHYPGEVLWMKPWKIWHYFWRKKRK